jgi:hypothetical protein
LQNYCVAHGQRSNSRDKYKQINDVTNVRVTRIEDYNIPMMVRVGELRKREIKEADEKLNLVEEE